MMSKPIMAVLLAALVAASGAAGSFYFAGAQEQAAVGQAEITVADEAQAGSQTDISGNNFEPRSDVSIYFMSAARARMTNDNVLVLQEIPANETLAAAKPEGGNLFENALNALSNLLGLSSNENTTASGADQGSLLVVLDQLASGTIGLKCGDKDVAQGELNDTNLVNLSAQSGTYDDCSISIDGDNGTNTGDIGSLTVTTDPDEDYEGSLVANATADNQGSFSQSVKVPDVEQGQYAILAVSSEGTTAVSALSVTAAAAETSTSNATGTLNETAPLSGNVTVNQTMPEGNTTVSQAAPENATTQNQTEQAAPSGEPSVQVEEAEAEPGKPLAISGDGFEPNTTVQVFINNIQITNIVTNVVGSFNTVVIVPTTVNAGSAEVSVKTGQTNVAENVNIVQPETENKGPATVRFAAVSATENAEQLKKAPVTIFDTSNGEIVESGNTPLSVELDAGTYSVFYSDFANFDFQSAEPGRWTDTDDGGSGLLTVKAGRNATVTAMYSEEEAPPPPPRETVNSITLRAEDTDGNPISGMFATIYDANTGEKVEQGFTELKAEDLDPGAYPVFFANFRNLEFLSASPGDWIQTPSGGAGLVTIPDDGKDHNVVVTAVYERKTATAQTPEPEFNIQAPLDIRGNIFTITSNETRPEGPFVMSGSFALKVSDEDPVQASLSAYFVSARDSSNENVQLDSQRSRDHDTFQIVGFKPQVARPIGLDSYLVSGSADLLLNGDLYSNDEKVEVMVRGGNVLTPTNIEIEFQGDAKYSAAHRLETLHGAVTSGFQ